VKKYKAVVDVDTLLIHAALAGQETCVLVEHSATGWQREFKTQTEFWGHYLKKEGGWLGDVNKDKESKGLPTASPDEFVLTPVVRLVPDAEMVVKGRFKNKVETIKVQPWCSDIEICFGVGENFRYEMAETIPYKNSRPPKPLMYETVKDYMLYKYANKMCIVEGVETDDIVAQKLHEAWERSGHNHDNLDTIGLLIDKDLKQFPSIQVNFDKLEEGLVKITELEAAKNLAVQMLMGDNIDSIPGLPLLDDSLFEKYKLRKTKKGVGETSAKGVVNSATSVQEVYERVVEAYRLHYGETKTQFISHNGVMSDRDWLDQLNERYRLLRMRTDVTKDVGHVIDFLKGLGFEYE
tara:strand:- start:60327 stop:61379 length:1053 start_codon:yes stop_codon:yes gene_type:complete